ncbi:hypothetical protein [Pseudoalteromonas luteoviolacea]|uniref:4Fe-4S ferredoxin-type domain-containing protein n=1 Tax=Pseudoalteromonas luteoviolacea NCIMB 1942 TaxID=1365253 RepID=A0A167G311_9GAMM|nr:hypothetical protein [Pseudoalteromonas luteoviolacea]KZN54052.1 hypothetical protein N482_24625 [Pseudoalteromonas luteoviolacea NCIMB 1942]KZW98495.1 hypothetical protein JL49_22880 [Pseudoalteromonas luteoviolacea]
MLKPLTKLFIVIATLVAFVGQASAYNFMGTTEHATGVQETPQSMQSVSDLNTTSVSGDDDCCEVDCCEADCICPANACIAFVYLSTQSNTSNVIAQSQSTFNDETQRPNSVQAPLFRPPIFTH